MDAGFVLALPFHHGDLEPDYVRASTRGAYARDENTSARLCAKNTGGAYAQGGAYLRDTTVFHLFDSHLVNVSLVEIHSECVRLHTTATDTPDIHHPTDIHYPTDIHHPTDITYKRHLKYNNKYIISIRADAYLSLLHISD